jgi:ribosomal-protein-alanine N-acetyltransferase
MAPQDSKGESAGVLPARLPIERMCAEDVAVVAAIDARTFAQAPGGPTPEQRMTEELARPWTRAWVAREGGEVVAYLLAWHVVDELHVLNVATVVAMRRRGFGGALVDAAVAYARESGIRLVVLEVRRSNRAALQLYRRVGFAAMGVRRAYYTDGEDAVEMLLELDPATGAVVPHRDEVKLDA